MKIYKNKIDEDYVEFSAKLIFDKIKKLIKKKKSINIALSGGNTPIPILKKLKDFSLKWDKINFFLVDERCVAQTDHDNNFRNLEINFFNYINAKSFPIISSKNYTKDASDYESIISKLVPINTNGIPSFDLIILGVGNDGHTASLFPNSDALDIVDKLIFFNIIDGSKINRITFTYPLILNSKNIFCLATKSKREIIDQIFKNDSNFFPISKICFKHKKFSFILESANENY